MDIKNAYGSIPHQLIFLALQRYGIPDKWIKLIKNYYTGLWSRSFSETAPSGWHHHERGIFAGCTVAIILFLSGINIIIEYILVSSAKNFVLSSRTTLPLVRAFMDDMDLMAQTVAGGQDLLSRSMVALNWARIENRADKSRSIVIKKGRTLNVIPFYTCNLLEIPHVSDSSNYIPSIHTKSVKFLGRIIDCSISDRKSVDELEGKLEDGLKLIDQSAFTGTCKLWILHRLLIPRVRWPLMIYEVPMSRAIKQI